MVKTKKLFRKRNKKQNLKQTKRYQTKNTKPQIGGVSPQSIEYFDAREQSREQSPEEFVDALEQLPIPPAKKRIRQHKNEKKKRKEELKEKLKEALDKSHNSIESLENAVVNAAEHATEHATTAKNMKTEVVKLVKISNLLEDITNKLSETIEKEQEYVDTEYDNNKIPIFWKPYIIKNNPLIMQDAISVKQYILNLINNIILCNTITLTTNDEPYHDYICNSFLFIAYITQILDTECTIIVKGGKAIQIAINYNECSSEKLRRYISPDVDIVIIAKPNSKYSPKILAKEIGKLFLWVMNSKNKIPIISLLDVTDPEPIIKLSLIKPDGNFYAIIDIGYNELDENIKSYFQGQSLRELIFVHNSGKIYYPTLLSLIHERLYYLIKYDNYKDLAEKQKRIIERFFSKIYKSINALLNCEVNKYTIGDKNNSNKIRFLRTQMLHVFNEKYRDIDESIRSKVINKISSEILTTNTDITQHYSPEE